MIKQVVQQVWSASGTALCCLAMTSPAPAQIASDGTLSTTVKTTDKLNFTITGGSRAGSNLFHSFSEFSVPTKGSAVFNNTADIRNIIGRVTGSSASNIDGLLKTNGTANLFLINPNGIIFGSNASLDVNGSFVATTANAIQFGTQGFFSASTPEASSLLTVNPSAFLFNQVNTQPITVNSRRAIGDPLASFDPLVESTFNFYQGLEVPNGKSIILVGNDVRLDGGILLAPGGRVELGGVAGTGTVGLSANNSELRLNFPSRVRRADVSLTNGAAVDVTAGNKGSISVNARNLDISKESLLRAGIEENLGSAGSQAGDITLDVTEALSLNQSSLIRNDLNFNATGNSGNVIIRAGSLSFDNSGFNLFNAGQGNAGQVTIEVSGPASFNGSGMFSFVGDNAIGNGADITIRAGSLSATNGSLFFASTFGQGDAGDVTMEVRGPVLFDDMNGLGFGTGIISNSDRTAKGKSGDITIRASSLSLINGAFFTNSIAGQGDAGNITIDVSGFVALTNDSLEKTNTIESKVESEGKGNGGNIRIRANALVLNNGARLSASSEANRTAGNIEVSARSIRLDNQAALSSDTRGGTGNIVLNSENLILSRDSSITTNAQGTATGGNITIDTGVLTALENSDITANAKAATGGQVEIDAQGIFRSPDSDITASSDLGPQFSGVVEINTPDVDPSQAVAKPPDAPVNVTVTQGCQASSGKQASVKFFNTGKGGLAPNPYEPLSSNETWEDVPQGTKPSASETRASEPVNPPNKIVEAQGWLINQKGEAVLVTEVPTPRSQHRCHLR